ncbi:MAG: hypothetical protein LBN02_02700 [Oscillospiraceae bacterium]|jgi:hypothetical protein|nr:hypothetical protein [Oscillospiraceae bacterium]
MSKIKKAFDDMSPNEEQKSRMKRRLLDAVVAETPRKSAPQWRRYVAAAAVVIVVGGYLAYRALPRALQKGYVTSSQSTYTAADGAPEIAKATAKDSPDNGVMPDNALNPTIEPNAPVAPPMAAPAPRPKGLPVDNFVIDAAADIPYFGGFDELFTHIEGRPFWFALVTVESVSQTVQDGWLYQTAVVLLYGESIGIYDNTAVMGSYPKRATITQSVYGGCLGDEKTQLVREGGVYLLPLIKYDFDDTDTWRVLADLGLLFEVDDTGRVWSHSGWMPFAKYDGMGVDELIGDVQVMIFERYTPDWYDTAPVPPDAGAITPPYEGDGNVASEWATPPDAPIPPSLAETPVPQG